VKKYASANINTNPFGDWYETTNGQTEGFRARPVVGGHLALVSPPIQLKLISAQTIAK
jgi:hypothetical protein